MIRFTNLFLSLVIGTIPFDDPLYDPDRHCAFCNLHVIEQQAFYEDEHAIALYNYKPVFPGHCLIIPRRHVRRFEELTDEEILHIAQVIRKVNRAVQKVYGTRSYYLLQKNGTEASQSVPHVHFHYVPQKAETSRSLTIWFRNMMAHLEPPLTPEALAEIIVPLREAIEEGETIPLCPPFK